MGRFRSEERYKQLVFRGSDWLTTEDSTGDGGEVHTPKVSGATKGTNQVQEVQTSAINRWSGLKGRVMAGAGHRRGRWSRLSAPELQGCYPWNSVGDLR